MEILNNKLEEALYPLVEDYGRMIRGEITKEEYFAKHGEAMLEITKQFKPIEDEGGWR